MLKTREREGQNITKTETRRSNLQRLIKLRRVRGIRG